VRRKTFSCVLEKVFECTPPKNRRKGLAVSRLMLIFVALTIIIHLNYNAYEKEIKEKKCEIGEIVW